jgi:O-acetylhomoserine/O-acetylserine sulfhydrylase-like pyridoxal-dependent enzyme
MAPVFQAPLDLGADICMTSATKFISGQSDVTGGILACRGEQLGKDIYFHQNAEGLHLGPFDCWLALRGLKTMALRMEKQQANAMVIARWLEAHPLVNFVNYPGLESNKGHELHKSQATGAGSILSFATGNVELSRNRRRASQAVQDHGFVREHYVVDLFTVFHVARVHSRGGKSGARFTRRPRPDLHGHRGRRGPHRRFGRGVHHRGARNGRVKF